MTSVEVQAGQTVAFRFTEELWSRGHFSIAAQLLSADFRDHDPVGGQLAGREGYVNMVRAFRDAFPDLRVRNEDVIVADGGAKVILRWTAVGTHSGPLMGLPATGRSVSLKGIDILRLRDGRVAERWGEFDALGMLEQLGALSR